MNNYQIPEMQVVAGIPCIAQVIIGVVLFIAVLVTMRKYSSGYATAAIISVGASLYLHSMPLAAGAFAVAAVVAIVALCGNPPKKVQQQQQQ